MSKILFTAIFGEYDILQSIKVDTGWRNICFTDGDIEVKGWEIVKMKAYPKAFRHIKSCPHLFLPEGTELSMWIDGNITPKMPLNHIIKGKDSGYTLMAHPARNCVYAEGQRCIELNKDDPKIINAQLAKYRREKYPIKNGMVATGVIIRTPGFEKFGEAWYEEIKQHSVRDQISFPVVATRHRLDFHTFPFMQGFNKVIHASKR